MSFSSNVKAELCRAEPERHCCAVAEACGVLLYCNTVSPTRIRIVTESDDFAARLPRLFRQAFGVRFDALPESTGKQTFALTDETKIQSVFHAIGYSPQDSITLHLNYSLLENDCCRVSFLRGAFLGAGTLTHPEKGYHFEWKAEDERLAETLEKLLEKCDLPYKSYIRKGTRVIYLKGAQQISDMLAVMGAGSSVLEMENIRINKQLRAAATRAANCDEHNSEKMLDAGHRQAEAIRHISIARGLFTLPPALREVARLRVENPDMSLQELGEMMDPPVGKSGVNHRLRRLMEIARQVEEEYGRGGKNG